MELRAYQDEARTWLIPRRRGFIHAPAGSGKTIIAASAAAVVAKEGWQIVWLNNTIEQCDQAVKAISSIGGPQGVDFIVCCVASCPDVSGAQLVIFDEGHHCSAPTWKALASRCSPEAIVWGFSATPWHEDKERNDSVRALFKEFFEIDRKRIEASGHLEKGKVYVHDVDIPGQFDREIEEKTAYEVVCRCRRFPMIPKFEHERRAKWQITQEFIQQNETRNQSIVSLCKSNSDAGHSVLLLVFSIEHGQKLVEHVPDSALVYSKLGKKARGKLISDFRDGSLRVLAATSLADEGLDVPRASVLVLASGGRSGGKLEQRAGRVLRPALGKKGGIIHDFLDAGACFAYAQAKARWGVYEKLGYEPELIRYR